MSVPETETSWVSVNGIRWALDDAPCPNALLPTLIAIARRTQPDGTGSCQANATIAATIGASREQVQRDVRKLLDLGLIRRGDQRVANRFPASVRPVVYDLALKMKGPKPLRESRNPSGRRRGAEPADSAGRKLTPRQRTDALESRKCRYCGDTAGPFEVEHAVPLSRGGTNATSNLACSCRPCNLEKSASTPDEWKARREAAGLDWPPLPNGGGWTAEGGA